MPDLRDAFRALRSSPVVSVVAVLSLDLGIGVNTAIFSILDSLTLRTLPVEQPGELGTITMGSGDSSFTNPLWEQIREREALVEGAFAWSPARFNLAQGGPAEMIDGIWASGGYFRVLGVPALLGRTFAPDDDRRGGGPAGPVAVISDRFWQQRYAGAADVVGRSLTIERVPFTIVGVTGPGFFGTEVGRTFDVAVPLGAEPLVRGKESALDRRSTWWLNVMVRRRPGQTLDATSAALRGVQPQIREATMPEHYRPEDRHNYLSEPLTAVDASSGESRLRTRYRTPLTAIMVVVGLVLLIACANIANLLLARATARRHEISVRLALGAPRARLIRQLLSKSLLLSGCGALLGLFFAQWGSRMLVGQLSTSTNTVFLHLGLDWTVLAFTTAMAVGTALLFGVAPALRASKVRPNEALKEQGRGISMDRRFGLGNILVVAQVALSLILVIAAGLFVRTFASLATLDLGFERDPVLVVNVNAQRVPVEATDRPAFYEQLRSAAAGVPGVSTAALSAVTPVSGSAWNFPVEIPGAPVRPERERIAFVNLLSPDFFRAMGTRLIAGRDFTPADRKGAPDVVIVNEAFAKKFFGGENPIGRIVRQPGFNARPTTSHQVVGYVQDAVYRSLRQAIPPTMYFPLQQNAEPPSGISISVRAAIGSPALLIKPLADSLTNVSQDVAITFRPLADQVNASLIQERVVAILSGFFGGLALLLAGLGLYGVTTYAVSRRRTELGIRMALGAAPGGVVRLVLRRVALLVGLGIVLGMGLAIMTAVLATK
ncbi:MAG: ABC transporter permease, partial [Acidobacteria bacterium]|nr:ABC transporter permease [Acidobacteriota bacterium]